MNSHEKSFDPEQEEFIARLARVPAREVSIDPQIVFYKAGFAAALAQQKIRVRRITILASAASILGLCLVATFAYRAGAAMAPQAIANNSALSNSHRSATSSSASQGATLDGVSAPEPTRVQQSGNDIDWLPGGALSQRQAASSDMASELEAQRPISLVGWGAARSGQLNSIHVGATGNQLNPTLQPPRATPINRRQPMHPRDWKSLLSTL